MIGKSSVHRPMGWDNGPAHRTCVQGVRVDATLPYGPDTAPHRGRRRQIDQFATRSRFPVRTSWSFVRAPHTVEDEVQFEALWRYLGLADWKQNYQTMARVRLKVLELRSCATWRGGSLRGPGLWDVAFQTAVPRRLEAAVRGFYRLAFTSPRRGRREAAAAGAPVERTAWTCASGMVRPELLAACVALIARGRRALQAAVRHGHLPVYGVECRSCPTQAEWTRGRRHRHAAAFGDTTGIDWWRDRSCRCASIPAAGRTHRLPRITTDGRAAFEEITGKAMFSARRGHGGRPARVGRRRPTRLCVQLLREGRQTEIVCASGTSVTVAARERARPQARI